MYTKEDCHGGHRSWLLRLASFYEAKYSRSKGGRTLLLRLSVVIICEICVICGLPLLIRMWTAVLLLKGEDVYNGTVHKARIARHKRRTLCTQTNPALIFLPGNLFRGHKIHLIRKRADKFIIKRCNRAGLTACSCFYFNHFTSSIETERAGSVTEIFVPSLLMPVKFCGTRFSGLSKVLC